MPLVLAHRGGAPELVDACPGRADAPTRTERLPGSGEHRAGGEPGREPWENTLAAFESAGRLGADGVELDVRRTSDGVLVVHHDPVAAGYGRICDVEHADLPPWVPTLAAALNACGPVVVDIELKNPPTEPGFDPDQRIAKEVVALLQARLADGAGAGAGSSPTVAQPVTVRPRQRYMVSSFWPDTLAAAVAAAPEDVTAGLLVHRELTARDLIDRARQIGCSILVPHWTQAVDPGLVDSAHQAGLAVATWTVNGAESCTSVFTAGVDMVVTDDVTGTLQARDRWVKSRSTSF